MIVTSAVAVCESHRCHPRAERSVPAPWTAPSGWFSVLIEWQEDPEHGIAASFLACSATCADRLATEVGGRELLRQVMP